MKPIASSSEAVEQALAIVLASFDGPEPARIPQQRRGDAREILDWQVKALELARNVFDEEVVKRLSHLNRKRNALVAFNNLPMELAGDILLRSVDVPSWSVSRLQELASVAVGWWHVIKATPRLWAVARVGSPDLALALRLSKGSLLQVYVPMSLVGTSEDLRNELTEVGRHSARWQSLDYRGPYLEAFRPYLQFTLPELRHLRLDNTRPRQFPSALDLAPCPRLRQICISNIALSPRDISNLSNITVLSLQNEAPRLPSAEELIKILLACPTLVELGLRCVWRTRAAVIESSGVQGTEVIPLPNLRKLALENFEIEATNLLLSRIRADNLERLEIRCLSSGAARHRPVTLRLFLSGNPYFSLFHTTVRNSRSRQLHLELSDQTIVIRDSHPSSTTENQRHSLELVLGSHDWLAVKQSAQLYRTLASFDLPLRLKLSSSSHKSLDPSFLGTLHNLQILTVADDIEWVSLLRYLSAPQRMTADEDGASSWPCPFLEKVKLPLDRDDDDSPEMTDFLEVIGELVRSRGEKLHTSRSGGLDGGKKALSILLPQEFQVFDSEERFFNCTTKRFTRPDVV